MNKKASQTQREIFDKLLPLLASSASIIVVLFYLLRIVTLREDTLQILVAIVASLAGIFISFFILKFLRQKREGNIFISYSHSDKKFVEKLIQSLRFKRFNIIYDEETIKVGDNIKEAIVENIKNADVIILTLSENNVKDDYINYEIKVALENKKKILPIIIDSNAKLPADLTEVKYADFSKDYEKSVQDLTKALIKSLDKKNSS